MARLDAHGGRKGAFMLWALNAAGKRVPAERGAGGACPQCGESVVPKCGEIIQHHWAHLAGSSCDTWSEGETNWHIGWKQTFRDEFQEIVETHGTETHRADVKFPDGTVIEFQRSALSPEEIKSREAFWGEGLVWVWDAQEAAREGRLTVRWNDGSMEICWSHHRRSIAFCERKVFIDMGDELILVKRFLSDPYRAPDWSKSRSSLLDERTVVGWGATLDRTWLARTLGLTKYEVRKAQPGMLFGAEVLA